MEWQGLSRKVQIEQMVWRSYFLWDCVGQVCCMIIAAIRVHLITAVVVAPAALDTE